MSSRSEEAFFFGEPGSRLFGVLHRPAEAADRIRSASVICAPFGDERTSTHRLMVEWARVLAADGFHVLRFDYRGYGDSDGEFEDHTIEDHLADTARALSEVEERSNLECGLLCGLRLGATLAAITACRNNRNPSLVLWEPVISGSEYVSEMLKASAFVTRGAQTADELENDIEKGKEVVVRGHILTKGMLRSLKAVNLLESPLPGSGPVMLAYFCSGSQNTPPALLELHRKYAAGGDINLKPIRGRAPWASGRDYCVKPPEVFGTTRDWLARHSISTCAHATQAARKKIAQATSTPELATKGRCREAGYRHVAAGERVPHCIRPPIRLLGPTSGPIRMDGSALRSAGRWG